MTRAVNTGFAVAALAMLGVLGWLVSIVPAEDGERDQTGAGERQHHGQATGGGEQFGDPAAIDTVRGWVGERVPARGLATAARAYNTQQQTAQEAATRRAAHQPTTQPAPAVTRPALTPGITPDHRRGRGR